MIMTIVLNCSDRNISSANSPSYVIGAHVCELNTDPANTFAHVMRLIYARWFACPT